MTVRPDRKFGLNVNRALSDVANRDAAIENLGLQIDDLDIIRNASSEGGVTKSDVRALAGLNVELPRYLTKLGNDVTQYTGIVNTSSGTKQQLRGNLTVNGVLAASSVKYSYLEEGTDEIKKADVSTSRISSWSSPDSPPTDTSPIFYGGDVNIGDTVTANNINLFNPAQEVRFRDSEVPTHKIQAEINGETVYLYAMKGIPLVFEGFFRSFNTEINLNTRGAVSVRIVVVDNELFNREFENIGGTNSLSANLIYSDTRSSRKNIEIYHPPDNLRTLQLNRIGLSDLPNAELSGLAELRLYRNLLDTFPDLTKFSPNITFLDIRENNFGNSDNPDLRKFNQAVVDRLPASLREIFIGNTFEGSITGDLRSRLTSLERIDLDSHTRGGSRPLFRADLDDEDGKLPEVADSVTVYSAQFNVFKSIPDSVKQLPNLISFDIRSNDITDRNFFIDSPDIEFIRTSRGNQINVADCRGKTNLRDYRSRGLGSGATRGGGDDQALVNPDGSYKFENCTSLQRLDLYNSRYTGFLPRFINNVSLSRVDFYNTRIQGGKSETEQDFVIYPDVFDDCAESIRFFRLASTSLINQPIHPDAFAKTSNMDYVYVRSFNRGVTGSIPDLSGMPNLRRVLFLQNNLTGPLPTLENNSKIFYIHVASNSLSGAIPNFTQNSLRYLYLHNNNFTSFSGLSCERLLRLFLRDNDISGVIPDMSNLTQLRDIYIQNNQFDGYVTGSFASLIRMRRLDISNNSDLTESDINNVIEDLFQNYNNRPRTGVRINIRNTATPTGEAVDKIDFLTQNGWIIRR